MTNKELFGALVLSLKTSGILVCSAILALTIGKLFGVHIAILFVLAYLVSLL